MSKLFKLKDWLTLEDTAKHISNVFGEPFSSTDLYMLSLQGKLQLSVVFAKGAKVKKLILIKTEDVEYKKVIPVGIPNIPVGHGFNVPINAEIPISKDYWIQKIEPEVFTICGVWDLAMKGAEKAEIANRYQLETSGHAVKIPSLIGHYVQRENVFYELQVMQARLPKNYEESFHIEPNKFECDKSIGEIKLKPRRLPQYRPAERLDEIENCLVVKTDEVTRFIQSLSDTSQDPIPQNDSPEIDEERATLLILIKLLCSKVKIDPKQRGITTSLVTMVDLTKASLSDDTIRKIVNQIEPVVCSKSKVRITRTLTTNEKNSFLVLIAALCKEAKLDSKDEAAVEALVNMSKVYGTPLLSDKISDLLKQIDNVVEPDPKIVKLHPNLPS